MLLECIESDEREAGIVESSRKQMIEGRLVAVRRERDAWLAAQSGGDSSSGVMREGHDAAGQRTAEDLTQFAQRQRLEWLVCALSKTKEERSIGEIPDMLARWRRSVQLASAVGAGAVVAAAQTVSKRQLRKQTRRKMRVLAAARCSGTRQTRMRCSVHRWGQQMEQERERRVRALMGAVACADATLQRRVWRKLMESFWLQRNGEADGWRIERKKERGDGRGEGKGDAVRYDWSCARCGWGGCSMEAGTIYCRKCEWQCEQWCAATERQTLCSIAEMDQAIQSEPVGKIVGNRMMQRMGEVRQQMQNQIEQLQLDGWKGEVAKVVEKELGEGRVDVRQLVIGVMDKVVGRELDGVLLPKPLLSAAAVEWPTKQGEAAAKQMRKKMIAQQQEETAADAKADEAPKAPVDLIARVTASIRQQKAEAESKSSSKMNDLIATVLASSRKSKKEQAANESGWSGGGGRMLGYILEGMTL